MNIALVYIYSPIAGGKYLDFYPERFVETYYQFSPQIEHQCFVVCNGTPANTETKCLFSALRNVHFLEHDDSGYDIGGYQFAARCVACDMMVFFGGSTYFKRPGWLRRMAEAWTKRGPGLYGSTANRGELRVKVWPHIRTTAFWCPPLWMNEYPERVVRPDQRFPFEHGPNCLTEWVRKQKRAKAWLVSWDGEYEWAAWDSVPNGYTKCPQTNILAGDRMTEPPYTKCP